MYEGRGCRAYEFLEGGVYRRDSLNGQKKVRCIKKLKSERKSYSVYNLNDVIVILGERWGTEELQIMPITTP